MKDWVRVDLDEPRWRVVRAPEWRRDGDVVEVTLANGKVVKERAWVGDVLAGVAAGEGFAQLVARFVALHPEERHRAFADHLVRDYVLTLHGRGFVDLGHGAPPPVVADRYQPEKLLGTGGFGCAWLATDRGSGENVVVKRAWSYYHRLADANAALASEAATLRRLDHPGVARLRESVEQDGHVHLVRDYVDGRDIAARAHTPASACLDVAEVARIVAHAHERGRLVLDFGPGNFYRRASDGRIVAIDLGLCVDAPGGSVKLSRMSGSRGYTSPEMRERNVATRRSDVWSLGALAFALLANRTVSSKWGDAETAAAVPDSPAAPLVRRCLARDPEARPATMLEAARLFEEAAARAA